MLVTYKKIASGERRARTKCHRYSLTFLEKKLFEVDGMQKIEFKKDKFKLKEFIDTYELTLQSLINEIELKYETVDPELLVSPSGPLINSDDDLRACKKNVFVFIKTGPVGKKPDLAEHSFLKPMEIVEVEDKDSSPPRKVMKSCKAIKSVLPNITPSKMTNTGKHLSTGELNICFLTIKKYFFSEDEFRIVDTIPARPCTIKIEEEKFDEGGFRIVHKMKLKGEDFVVKFYNDEAIRVIESHCHLTTKAMCFRAVKTSALCDEMMRRYQNDLGMTKPIARFLECFVVEAFSGASIRFPTVQFPVVGEPFINCKSGILKFINNDGLFDTTIDTNILAFCEGFCHYVFEKSNKELLPLDMQAFVFDKTDMVFTDPEVATMKEGDGNWLFTPGNLGRPAIQKFFGEHTCIDTYCGKLALARPVFGP